MTTYQEKGQNRWTAMTASCEMNKKRVNKNRAKCRNNKKKNEQTKHQHSNPRQSRRQIIKNGVTLEKQRKTECISCMPWARGIRGF
jgi:hypothetical protein